MTILEAKNLYKSFGGLKAVQDVSIQFKSGELTSIIGPNGAGKTTFFNLLTGLLKPDQGSIFFLNDDVTNLPIHKLVRRGMARSFQIMNIFDKMNLYENIRISVQAQKGHGKEIFSSTNSLKEVNKKTEEIISALGFEGKEDIAAENLSYGDRRVLEIGIVLGSEPKLILLDEPTSGMGSSESGTMTSFIKELSKKVDIVLIEHDMNIVLTISDRIVVLDQGSIIADGNPDEIKKSEKVQEAYLGGLKV